MQVPPIQFFDMYQYLKVESSDTLLIKQCRVANRKIIKRIDIVLSFLDFYALELIPEHSSTWDSCQQAIKYLTEIRALLLI